MKSTKSEQSVLSTSNSPHQWPSARCWRNRFCCARASASEISASAAKYGSARSGAALGNAMTFRDELIENVDLTTPTERCRSYDACAASTSACLPVLWPLPQLTPLKASVSLPRPVGFGFGPKLNLIVFQVSPRFACKPRLAVGSYPQCTMQFSQRGSRATPSTTPYFSHSTFSSNSE